VAVHELRQRAGRGVEDHGAQARAVLDLEEQGVDVRLGGPELVQDQAVVQEAFHHHLEKRERAFMFMFNKAGSELQI
jgi:hypothetical protein